MRPGVFVLVGEYSNMRSRPTHEVALVAGGGIGSTSSVAPPLPTGTNDKRSPSKSHDAGGLEHLATMAGTCTFIAQVCGHYQLPPTCAGHEHDVRALGSFSSAARSSRSGRESPQRPPSPTPRARQAH